MKPSLKLQFSANQITRLLISIVATLSVIHFGCQFAAVFLKHGSLFGLTQLFNLNQEANIPTFYSAAAIAFCAFLLALIGCASRQTGKPHHVWYAFSAIILFLALDEGITIHERMIFLRATLNFVNPLYYLWIIPYVALTFAVGLSFPKFVRGRLTLASFVFALGAIGLDAMTGKVAPYSVPLAYFVGGVEEVVEMSAFIIAIHTLLSYIETEFKGLSVSVGPPEPVESLNLQTQQKPA